MAKVKPPKDPATPRNKPTLDPTSRVFLTPNGKVTKARATKARDTAANKTPAKKTSASNTAERTPDITTPGTPIKLSPGIETPAAPRKTAFANPDFAGVVPFNVSRIKENESPYLEAFKTTTTNLPQTPVKKASPTTCQRTALGTPATPKQPSLLRTPRAPRKKALILPDLTTEVDNFCRRDHLARSLDIIRNEAARRKTSRLFPTVTRKHVHQAVYNMTFGHGIAGIGRPREGGLESRLAKMFAGKGLERALGFWSGENKDNEERTVGRGMVLPWGFGGEHQIQRVPKACRKW